MSTVTNNTTTTTGTTQSNSTSAAQTPQVGTQAPGAPATQAVAYRTISVRGYNDIPLSDLMVPWNGVMVCMPATPGLPQNVIQQVLDVQALMTGEPSDEELLADLHRRAGRQDEADEYTRRAAADKSALMAKVLKFNPASR